jgi:hypothetical protein
MGLESFWLVLSTGKRIYWVACFVDLDAFQVSKIARETVHCAFMKKTLFKLVFDGNGFVELHVSTAILLKKREVLDYSCAGEHKQKPGPEVEQVLLNLQIRLRGLNN